MPQYQLLIGSLEIDDNTVTAGVHTGPSPSEPENLRYVRASFDEGREDETPIAFLGRIYEDSEGCLLLGTFKRRSSPA